MISTRYLPPDFNVFGGLNLRIKEVENGVFEVVWYEGEHVKYIKHMTLTAMIHLLFPEKVSP